MPAVRWVAKWGILTAAAVLFPTSRPLLGQDINMHGKVVMGDGSPLPKAVAIQRVCPEKLPVWQAGTDKTGEYSWSDYLVQGYGREQCFWRAVLPGYISSEIDYATFNKNRLLPDIVLSPEADYMPKEAGARWERASKAIKADEWVAAESDLRSIVAEFPKTALAWTSLGTALEHQQRIDEARQAYERAIKTSAASFEAYHFLAMMELANGDFAAAEKAAAMGTHADLKNRIPALYLDLATARYRLHADGGEAAARKAIALDKKHEMSRAEYILGLILQDAQDPSAATHLRRYLELAPNAPEAAEVQARIAKLEAGKGVGQAARVSPEAVAAQHSLEGTDEVVIPGGLGPLATIARLPRTPSSEDFFAQYCRTVVDRAAVNVQLATDIADAVHAYLAAATELSGLVERGSSRVTLSLDSAHREKAVQVLRLLGWKVGLSEGMDKVEPSEDPEDAPRQQVAPALGIDEVEMAKALGSGGTFQFEIHPGRAVFIGARAWSSVFKGVAPSGFLEAFARNPQYAATYAALPAAGAGAAEALVANKGLGVLVSRYADILRLYGEVLTVSGGRAASPGGPEADAVWLKLAGASPADPKAFLPALLDRDQGRLAAFYFALGRGDAAHQQFFTRTADRAERFYRWYKNEELRTTFGVPGITWRQDLFRDLPLDASGEVQFPGGKAAWTWSSAPSDEALLEVASLEGLVPVARLEERRRRPLDADSALLLAEHYKTWRSLFPYFETLTGLGREEFQALAAFEESASGRPTDTQNKILGEWHSLVKLAELGVDAGSLDAAAAARAFRGACQALSAPDYSAKALAALRAMAGGSGDLDEAVAGGLLRLSGDRRARFDRVREMQKAPLLASTQAANDAQTMAALSGLVYAALLDPDHLLVSEDPHLLAKHKFARGIKGTPVFPPSTLNLDSEQPGSSLEGGFMTFEEQVKDLARGVAPAELEKVEISAFSEGAPYAGGTAQASPAQPIGGEVGALAFLAPGAAAGSAPQTIFRVSGRLVEVYATVVDGRNHYADDLSRGDFTVLDKGKPVEIGAFENRTSAVSVALLVDATGSMKPSLPALKASALRLIEDLRPIDSLAVYSFNSKVSELQSFTHSKDAAKRAVLKVRATGTTGLNDALVRVTRDLSGRVGKKVIVVFTDGADNASGLTSDAVTQRARMAGIPIYTIAHGEALRDNTLMKSLETIAQATGALAFAIRTPSEISGVFEHVSQDIEHGYYFAFQPAPGEGHLWRTIEVQLRNNPLGRKVRAREGYYTD